VGLRDRLRGFLGRDEPAPPEPPRVARTVAPPVYTVPTATTRVDGALVIDVRPAARFAAGHLQGARNVALADVAAVPRDRAIVVVCDDGVASSGVAERLAALGARASWLDGGMAGR
jgi:rhodanese-related sulfurtransferase